MTQLDDLEAFPTTSLHSFSFANHDDYWSRRKAQSASCTNLAMPARQQTSQAVFTTGTQEPWQIHSANDYATMIFPLDKALKRSSPVDLIVEERREWLVSRLQAADEVILCGDVLPVVKRSGTGAASVWIKKRRNAMIWVIEEIEEGVCTLSLDEKEEMITAVHGDDFLGDVVGRLDAVFTLDGLKYNSYCTTSGLPCTVERSVFSSDKYHKLRVSYLPHVAGMVIVDDLTIVSANSVTTNSLFGYKHTAGMKITDIIPSFSNLVRKVKDFSGTAFKEAATGVTAKHRDGNTLLIDISMRYSEKYALWISYDRKTTPEIDVPRHIQEYTIIEEMGAGAYGQVKLARYGRKRQKVVLKYVTKARILVDTWTRDRKLGTVPLEIHVLNHLKAHPHRNLVEMKDFFEDDLNYYIVMSAHTPGMDLFDYIELNTSMTEWECKCISLQVAKALQHLHSLDIVHRDIKDENVVLDRDGWVKLIDFGSANYCRNGPFETFHGTLDYASPEALDGKPYMGKEQDVWACGILFYTLIYKENPFYNIDEIMDRDLRVPYIMSDESIDLVRRMLNRDVGERLRMEEVVEHPWYKGVEASQEKVKIEMR